MKSFGSFFSEIAPGGVVVRKPWLIERLASRALRAYADWRVGATKAEKLAHKTTPAVFLTFDDYGAPRSVERLLRVLREENVRAGFFIQGDWAELHPRLVEKIAREGHVLGNHTYSHRDLLSLTDDEVTDEIVRGLDSPWVRPPRGRYDARVRRLVHELDRVIVYWTIDSEDWKGVSPDFIMRKVMTEMHPGAVVLFHLHAPYSIDLMPELIREIRSQGYELCALDEPVWRPLR